MTPFTSSLVCARARDSSVWSHLMSIVTKWWFSFEILIRIMWFVKRLRMCAKINMSLRKFSELCDIPNVIIIAIIRETVNAIIAESSTALNALRNFSKSRFNQFEDDQNKGFSIERHAEQKKNTTFNDNENRK